MAAGDAAGERGRIVVGTRGSPLALAQAERAVEQLRSNHPDIDVDIRVVTTTGDASQETPLAELGLGVFTKELEMALLNKSIDVAVHSLKDMSATMPEGFTIAAVLEREDPCDVLVSRSGARLAGAARGRSHWDEQPSTGGAGAGIATGPRGDGRSGERGHSDTEDAGRAV